MDRKENTDHNWVLLKDQGANSDLIAVNLLHWRIVQIVIIVKIVRIVNIVIIVRILKIVSAVII